MTGPRTAAIAGDSALPTRREVIGMGAAALAATTACLPGMA